MKTLKHLGILCILLFGLSACDNNPVDGEHGHADVTGLALEMEDREIVVVSNAQTTGSITVQVGQETPDIIVEWRDADGNHFHDDDLDANLTLGHASNDEAVAAFEHHANDGRWTFHIHGESVGSTSIELQLFNDDHVDFRTPPIIIEVVQ